MTQILNQPVNKKPRTFRQIGLHLIAMTGIILLERTTTSYKSLPTFCGTESQSTAR
jgi:hypothetical protein